MDEDVVLNGPGKGGDLYGCNTDPTRGVVRVFSVDEEDRGNIAPEDDGGLEEGEIISVVNRYMFSSLPPNSVDSVVALSAEPSLSLPPNVGNSAAISSTSKESSKASIGAYPPILDPSNYSSPPKDIDQDQFPNSGVCSGDNAAEAEPGEGYVFVRNQTTESAGCHPSAIAESSSPWMKALRDAECRRLEEDLPLGVVARTYCVLNGFESIPSHGLQPLKWEIRGRFPEGASRCCYLPCIHEEHIYAALETSSNALFVASLWKAPLSDLTNWTQEDLPNKQEGWRWYWRSYFFSYAGSLYFIGKRKGNALFAIWRQERPGYWSEINAFPHFSEGWQDFGVTVHNDNLVICGGNKSFIAPALEVISLALNEPNANWNQNWPRVTSDLYSPSVMTYGGRLHVTGSESHCNVYTLVNSEDRSTCHWSDGNIKNTPHYRSAVETVNNCLVACAGYQKPFLLGIGARSDVYMYCESYFNAGNKSNSQWLPLPSLRVARRRPYLLQSNHGLVCLSGFNGMFVRDIEVLGLPSNSH